MLRYLRYEVEVHSKMGEGEVTDGNVKFKMEAKLLLK